MAEETGDVRFGRSAFGGFNRRDVMEYIDKMQRDALAQLMRERDALEQENGRLREENARLRAQVEADGSPQQPHGGQSDAAADEAFSATAETVSDAGRQAPMRDADRMTQKYFG